MTLLICPHSYLERVNANDAADGYCALCAAAELQRLRRLIQAARDAHVYHRCPAATGGPPGALCLALQELAE